MRQIVEFGLGYLGVLPDAQYLLGDLRVHSLRREAERKLAVGFPLLAGRRLALPLAGSRVFGEAREAVKGVLDPDVLPHRARVVGVNDAGRFVGVRAEWLKLDARMAAAQFDVGRDGDAAGGDYWR